MDAALIDQRYANAKELIDGSDIALLDNKYRLSEDDMHAFASMGARKEAHERNVPLVAVKFALMRKKLYNPKKPIFHDDVVKYSLKEL